jgi:hypothetical protein
MKIIRRIEIATILVVAQPVAKVYLLIKKGRLFS